MVIQSAADHDKIQLSVQVLMIMFINKSSYKTAYL